MGVVKATSTNDRARSAATTWRSRSPSHAVTSSWFISFLSAQTAWMYLRYTDKFLRMAVGSWTAMFSLDPLVVGRVLTVSLALSANSFIARDSFR